MLSSLKQSTSATIRQWEEAGAVLSNALGKYLELCNSLKTTLLREDTRPVDLAIRIDCALGSLHTELDRQLALSRVALSRTRNELITPAHHLPEELLSEIFMNIVFGEDVWEHPDGFGPHSMEGSLSTMNEHLHRLLSVCTKWRNTLLARDVFWSIVGTYKTWKYGTKPIDVNLPIRGTEGDNLQLVMSLPLPVDFELDVLKEHASRFRTINIEEGELDDSSSSIKNIINLFLKNKPSSLSELSIFQPTTESYYPRIPSEDTHIFHYNSSDWGPFLEIMTSLSVLRITGVAFSWRHMAFSNRLIELRLHTITIGYDSEFPGFLNVLSSAPELRDLKLISIVTLHDQFAPLNTTQGQQCITLPRLKSLLLENLYFNTLEPLLRWITPSQCQLTLYLSDRSTETALPNSEPDPVDIESLCSLLRPITIDTLVLSRCQLADYYLHELLKSMPALKSLKVHLWKFGSEGGNALSRPGPEGGEFPKLEQLYLASIHMNDADEEILKDIVASHSIQKLVLGGLIYREDGGVLGFQRLEGDEAVCVWLRAHVPCFRLVKDLSHTPEFFSNIWQLW